MIPAMYNDIRLSQTMLDEADQDTSLEVSSGLCTEKESTKTGLIQYQYVIILRCNYMSIRSWHRVVSSHI